MLLMTDVVALAVHLAVHILVQVAVPAAVSVAEMMPVLAVVQVLVVVEGDTSPSPAASDGCPLGMMLLTVVAAAAVRVAVLAVVLSTVQVAGLSGLIVVTSPSPGGYEPWSAFSLFFFPFPTVADAAGTLALSS
ncbi:hypothetical protein NDU88_008173 [Pleurodeles waltl]|uniref:Secreted peptide n=1 Tax=Pleurodeles waltl TaxID=8319 RepID=A0AAV7VRS7_PLEWA|nr:hypothetical protein NDU88_008173 [Pleurodeles waltl]